GIPARARGGFRSSGSRALAGRPPGAARAVARAGARRRGRRAGRPVPAPGRRAHRDRRAPARGAADPGDVGHDRRARGMSTCSLPPAMSQPRDAGVAYLIVSEPVLAHTGTATVLFTDLVGSTELRARVGEDAAETLRRAHD